MSNSRTPDPRVTTPSRSPGPLSTALPPMPPDDPAASEQPSTPRRSSFSFLRRGKSVERLNSKRSTSGAKLSKKQRKEAGVQAQREAAAIPKEAPIIPDMPPPPKMETFGGENARPDSYTMIAQRAGSQNKRYGYQQERSRLSSHGVPMPPVPDSDPYARTESMTNRGRYSYASSVVSTLNSPRRVRRRKDPTPFNVLVVGAESSGKTAFIEFLRQSLALPTRKQRHARDDLAPEPSPNKFARSGFLQHYLETELDDGERIGLTIWDSEGIHKNSVDLQMREISSFIESKFEDTFTEEMKVVRSPGVRDTHIHCVFLVLDPLNLDANMKKSQTTGQMKLNGNFSNGGSYFMPPSPQNSGNNGIAGELELQALRTLQGKTTVVPVISKADTITVDHMNVLKHAVWDSLKAANIDTLEALGLEDDAAIVSSSEEEDDDEDDDDVVTPRSRHNRHDSKRFDERDEDTLLHPASAMEAEDRSTHSRLDLTSSSSASSAILATPKEKELSQPPTTPLLPLSIITPSPITAHEPGIGRVGRRFPWGSADPYDPAHCDFVRLREAVFGQWRSELREASREIWYERWRTTRLDRMTKGANAPARGANGGQSTGRAGLAQPGLSQDQSGGGREVAARSAQWPLVK